MLTAAILGALGALAAALAHIDRQRREIRRLTGERDVAREAALRPDYEGNERAFDAMGATR